MKNQGILKTTIYFVIAACLTVVLTASGVSAAEQPKSATPTVSPHVPPEKINLHSGEPDIGGKLASKPAGATAPGVPGIPASKPGTAGPGANDGPIRLYMPDSQLKSHIIRVYVNREIPSNQNPPLLLLRSHAVTAKAADEDKLWEPKHVAPDQEWVESIDGQQVRRSGTLLLYDLSEIKGFGLKAMLRVMPVLFWKEGGTDRVAVGAGEVNLGNTVTDIGWTVLVVGFVLLIIVLLAIRGGGNPLNILNGANGRLSLAQTQVACWTVVVGGVVFGYGLVRLTIPDIPSSLLALMGTSLTTGGLAYFKDEQKHRAATVAAPPPVPYKSELGDLVRNFTPGQEPELSLAKTQMIFWTMLLIILFISKSVLDGVIWDVPWALVALMGFSQTGYLIPKLMPQH
jgi:hypothetical protein